MPKATLSFNLPDEQPEFEQAQKGGVLQAVIQEYDNYLRQRLKYEELPEPVREALQAARDKLWEEVNEGNLRDFFS